MSTNALNSIATDCVEALGRIGDLLSSQSSGRALLSRLGWGVSAVPAPLLTLASHLQQLRSLITQASSNPDSPQVWISLSTAVVQLVGEIRNLASQGFGSDMDALGMGVQLAEQLLQWAALEQLDRRHPGTLAILRAIGVVQSTQHPTDGARPPYLEEKFVLPDFGSVFASPATLLRAAWAWGDPAFDGTGMLTELIAAFRALGVPAGFVAFPPSPRELTEVDPGALRWHMVARFLSGSADGASYEAGLRIFNLKQGTDPAIAVIPYVEGSLAETVPFGDGFSIAISGGASAQEGRALVIAPTGIQLVNDVFGEGTPDASIQISAKLQYQPADAMEISLGLAVVQASGWSVRAAVSDAEGAGGELIIEASLTDARIVLPTSGDGLLGSLLGGQATIPVPLLFGVSSQRGVYLGASGLSLNLPVSFELRGVDVRSISLKLGGIDHGLSITVGLVMTASVGPIGLTIAGLGTTFDLTFPASGGNLGVLDVAPDFNLPSGVGLAVDAAGVSGGGFLAHDDPNHEYSGVLQLEFNNLALQAFGLITSPAAGGPGYSLLALVDADFPPIQLGWGFTLNGVGGLLALNRTASVDALRASIKGGKVAAILFPKNAIKNAQTVLTELDTLFPAAAGRFLFSPMALIGWGTPTILTISLAVVIELPEPIQILLLALLQMRLPSPSTPLVHVNLDALGVLDLSQDSLSLDASLFDSKLLDYTLSGDMALRANWGSSGREFLLAIGGFHPQFTPPADFPGLQRITIDMPSGPVSKLRLAAYLAVTSNTVQFGATLDVFIGVAGFGLSGHLGFDALLQLSPFHFEADISGRVALTAGGDDLMSVELDANLSGPAPWNIAGQFKLHIVFFDVTKSFSHSWGQDAPTQQIASVDVSALLLAALADTRNWGAALPPDAPALVSLHDPGISVVHPLARLEVHESVVPLGLSITRYGSAPVTGAASFTIANYQVNGTPVANEAVEDDFAPAQYFDLSDTDKLAGPSFEPHDAGLRLTGAGLVTCGSPVSKTISYETFYIDQAGGALRTDAETAPHPFALGDLQFVFSIGASGRASIRTAGGQRYAASGTLVKIAPQSFVIADRSTLAPAGIAAAGTTFSDAQAVLQAVVAQNPARRASLQIIATHEMPAS